MSLSKARSALVSAFMDGGFFTQAQTAFENLDFKPPTGAPWCKLSFVPTAPTVATLGGGGTDRFTGFLQADLNYPLNTGEKALNDKFESIRNVFTAGTRFTYSGQEVVIANCGRSQGRVLDGFYRVSVTVFFYAHVTR